MNDPTDLPYRVVSTRRCAPTVNMLLRMILLLLGIGPAASWFSSSPTEAQEPSPNTPEFRDFGPDLPRIAPRSPEQTLKSLVVDSEFRVELVATEPEVVDPIAVAFDHDGTMYVVEMRGYSEDGELNLGRIRRLQDNDDDGFYETSQVFAEGLSWPTAVTCYGNGVFVAAAPYLFYLQDTDRDGRADTREVIYEGFRRHNVQGLVNTLKWGPDNRIHGATSSTGATLVRPNQEGEPLELKGRDFSFDPRTFEIRATSGGGQHGLSFNRWGEKFVCSNSDHIQQITYDDRYLGRNAYFRPPAPRISIAADGPQADVFRSSPIEPWREIRTRLRVTGRVPGPIERGGQAAGYFTGSTGITIYRGDNWPDKFLDWAFVCDVGSNLIHRKRLTRQGTHYVAHRVDEGSEFVTSPDIWFRPVQLANAPDGALIVLDMAREVIEHPASLPPPIKQHLDLTSGRDRGRIFRIVSKSSPVRRRVRLGDLPPVELVEHLDHPNGWHRETAARLIFENCASDEAVDTYVTHIRQLVHNKTTGAPAKHRALWLLASFDKLQADDVLRVAQSPSAHLRRLAFELSESLLESSDFLRSTLLEMDADAEPFVAVQQAFTLGGLPVSTERRTALMRLVRRHTGEPLVLAAVQTGLGQGAASLLAEAARSPEVVARPSGLDFVSELGRQVQRQAHESEVAEVLRLVEGLTETPVVAQVLLGELVMGETPVSRALRNGQARQLLDQQLERARTSATNPDSSDKEKHIAIALLAVDEFERSQEIYDQLLRPTAPLEFQDAAFHSLSRRQDAEVADFLVQRWSSLSPTRRTGTVKLLLSRAPWKKTLLEALADGRVNVNDLSAYQRQRLRAETPAELWKKIEPDAKPAPTLATFTAKYRQAVATASVSNGQKLFRDKCATCHRLEGFGNELGPNLATMRARGADAIVTNVLYPNREVNPQYIGYTAITHSGTTLSGMIGQETETSIELVDADNKRKVILRNEIDELVSSGKSLMPEGWHKELTPEQLADIVAYLMQIE